MHAYESKFSYSRKCMYVCVCMCVCNLNEFHFVVLFLCSLVVFFFLLLNNKTQKKTFEYEKIATKTQHPGKTHLYSV